MAEIYRLPAVSPTMEVGTIVAWRKQVGETVASGDVLVEVGTDKATMEAQAFEDGVLLARLVDEDAEVPVNAPIAVIGTEGEDVAALVEQARQELAALLEKGGKTPAPAAGTAEPEAEEPEAEAPEAEEPAAPERTPPAAPAAEKAAPASVSRRWMGRELPRVFLDPPGDLRIGAEGRRVLASPLARKVAEELGVDLSRVRGSGPGGRIVRADVEAAATRGVRGVAAPAADQTVKLTPMRKTIARRLLEVHQNVPTFHLTVTFDMTAFVKLREALKALRPDTKVSYNDLLLLCVARALRDYPRANASWGDKAITRHGRVDLGFAVALDEGLITPVLRGADRMTLDELAAEVRRLAAKAREGRLTPEEYEGNTFTVSNLGMYGIEHFTAILNPPASAILATGALAEVPVVENGRLGVGWRMTCTMTCDHRVIDGAVGATFLQVLRRYVENPGLLGVG